MYGQYVYCDGQHENMVGMLSHQNKTKKYNVLVEKTKHDALIVVFQRPQIRTPFIFSFPKPA
jgi:hypothetical protein